MVQKAHSTLPGQAKSSIGALMRLISKVRSHSEYKRLMLFQTEDGVLLFFYNTETDAPCVGDMWFQDLSSAYKYTAKEFGIPPQNWEVIPDPLPNCQDDFIQPVRLKSHDDGSPKIGSFETLVNGIWEDYIP